MAGRQIRKTRKSSWKVDKAPSARREVVLSKFQKMAPAEVEEWGRVRKQVIESLTHKLGPATRAQIAEAERQADIALRVKNPHYYPDVDLGLRRVGVFPLAEASHKKAQLIEKGVAGVQIRRHGVSSKYEVWVPRGEERIRAAESNPGRPPHLPMGKPLDIYMNEVIVVPGFPQYRARRGTIAQVLQQKYNTQQLNYMVWSKPALAGEPNIETAEELEDLYRQSNPQSRFEKLTHQLEKRGAESPRALAAWIGRRKYGAAGFQKMAQAGRRAARAHSNPAFSEAMFGTVKDVAKHKQSGPYRIYYPLPVASLLEAHDKREHTEQETGVDWAVFEYNRRFGIIPLEWLVDARMFLKAHAAPSQCDLQTGEVREATRSGKGIGSACRTFYRELTRMENPTPEWAADRKSVV